MSEKIKTIAQRHAEIEADVAASVEGFEKQVYDALQGIGSKRLEAMRRRAALNADFKYGVKTLDLSYEEIMQLAEKERLSRL